MQNYDSLLTQAQTIRDASAIGENTALRLGTLFVQIVNELADLQEASASSMQTVIAQAQALMAAAAGAVAQVEVGANRRLIITDLQGQVTESTKSVALYTDLESYVAKNQLQKQVAPSPAFYDTVSLAKTVFPQSSASGTGGQVVAVALSQAQGMIPSSLTFAYRVGTQYYSWWPDAIQYIPEPLATPYKNRIFIGVGTKTGSEAAAYVYLSGSALTLIS